VKSYEFTINVRPIFEHFLLSKAFKTTPRGSAGEEWIILFLRVSSFVPRCWFSTMQHSLLNKSIVLHWSIYSEFWLVLKYSNPLHPQFLICVLLFLPWYLVLYIPFFFTCVHKCTNLVPHTITFTLLEAGSNNNWNQFSECVTVSTMIPHTLFLQS